MNYRTAQVMSQAGRPLFCGHSSNLSATDDVGTRRYLTSDSLLEETTHESLVVFTESRHFSCFGDVDLRSVPMPVKKVQQVAPIE